MRFEWLLKVLKMDLIEGSEIRFDMGSIGFFKCDLTVFCTVDIWEYVDGL